eukprot:13747720-Heterocapsa_arctica.AAC.1
MGVQNVRQSRGRSKLVQLAPDRIALVRTLKPTEREEFGGTRTCCAAVRSQIPANSEPQQAYV